jgi:Mycoplasma protein of unknown function, DUF285.
MSYMFSETLNFQINIGNWDLTNVLDISYMFSNSNFNQPITYWNASSITNMTSLFENNTTFVQNITYWIVDSTVTLTNMFSGSTSMTNAYNGTPGYGSTPTSLFF